VCVCVCVCVYSAVMIFTGQVQFIDYFYGP